MLRMGRPLWQAECTWVLRSHRELAKLRWWLEGLDGYAGSVQIWDFKAPRPLYETPPTHWADGATVTLAADAAVGATSIDLSGLEASKIAVVQGQYVQVGNRLYLANADVTADGAGLATIGLNPGLFVAATAGAAIRLSQAACEMRLEQADWPQDGAYGQNVSVSARFVETADDASAVSSVYGFTTESGLAVGDILRWNGNQWVPFSRGADGTFLQSSDAAVEKLAWTKAREVLTAARTYYVRTDGSDANTGLADTAGAAFLTIQKAVNTVASLDTGGNVVTIQIADGTYTGTVTLKNVPGFSAPGDLIIKGNAAARTNVIISTAGSAFSAARLSSVWDIKDLKITTSAAHGIIAQRASVRFGNIEFGAIAGTALWCGTQGNLVAISNYGFGGNCGAHVHCEGGSSVVLTSRTITCSADSSFNVFAEADHVGYVEAIGVTISLGGFTVTGQRYLVNRNADMYVGGAGANFWPGSIAGATDGAGTYL